MPLGADPLIVPVVPKEMGGFSPDLLMALFFGVTCSPGGMDWGHSGAAMPLMSPQLPLSFGMNAEGMDPGELGGGPSELWELQSSK